MNIYIQMQISIFKEENIGCILRWRHLTTVLSLPSQKGSNQCVFIKKNCGHKVSERFTRAQKYKYVSDGVKQSPITCTLFQKENSFQKVANMLQMATTYAPNLQKFIWTRNCKKSPYTCNHKKSLSDRDRTKL